MSEIQVKKLDEGRFGVELHEGTESTNHVVTVPEEFVQDLGLEDVEPDVLVRESIAFLLEREPATSIMPEFALADIELYFEDYPDEIQRRLSPA